MQFSELNREQRKEIYDKAFTFMHDHTDHVHSLFDKNTPSVAPSGSDMFKPELWKGIHWVWFLTCKGDVYTVP